MIIVDILFTMGTIGFGLAAFRQLKKIYRTHKTDGISITHWYIKLSAVLCMSIGYTICGLPLSFTVSVAEATLVIASIYYVTKYRKLEDENK